MMAESETIRVRITSNRGGWRGVEGTIARRNTSDPLLWWVNLRGASYVQMEFWESEFDVIEGSLR
jgi:hypothetical protein